MTNYVTYFRVSTQKQGASGLGLDAQRETVSRFVASNDGAIIGEFTEVESGKNSEREELEKAIALARAKGATLLVAKLDRLSRDVKFIFELRESGAKFIACDLPEFNTLTLGIFAAFAQYEREIISARTKDGLAQAKKRGVKLGNAQTRKDESGVGWMAPEITAKGIATIKANAAGAKENRQATELIASYRKEGKTFAQIAEKLNALHFKTRKKKEFKPMTVKRLYDRSQQ